MNTSPTLKHLLLIATFCLGATSASADNIPSLYNTGVDNTGTSLPDGSTDPHYVIQETSGNAILIDIGYEENGTYIANTAASKWVWQQVNGNPGNVVRTFRLTFDMSGLDPSTADISGRWSSDNNGLDILVNGNSTGQSTAFDAFVRWNNFIIPSQHLVGGLNTIDFKVNEGGAPGAFRAEFLTGTADPITTGVPDASSSLGLMTLGLATLGFVRRAGRNA